MRLIDYLDKGASLGEAEPCMEMQGSVFSYGDVQRLSYRIANALRASGTRPGDKVAILSHNDPVAFSCVFGISRAGAVWCPINPRSEAAENRLILDAFDCTVLIFQRAFASLVEKIARGMTLQETIAEIRRQGGIVYVPHPFDRMHSVPDYEHLLTVLDDVDALEVFNPRIAISEFFRASRLPERR